MASEHRAGFIAIVLTTVGTAGCTMCPDLFDYCGPVPNGSVAQNDFAARSNGILPLRAAPSPWPRLVADEPTPAAEPAAEDEQPVVLAGAEDAVDPDPVDHDEVEPVDLEQTGDESTGGEAARPEGEAEDAGADEAGEIVEPENVDVR